MRDWIAPLRDLPVARVARALELTLSRDEKSLSPCPSCGATSRGKSDPRPPVGFARGGAGWECFACHTTGDALDLASYLLLSRPASQMAEDAPRLEAFFAERGMLEAALTPQAQEPPPSLERFPGADLATLWALCESPGDSRNTEALTYLRHRDFDPAAFQDLEVLKILPPNFPGVPDWPQKRHKYALACRLFSPQGEPQGFHARAIFAAAKIKALSAKEVSGLFLMNEAARQHRSAPFALVLEGLTDFLRACLLFREEVPILGCLSGSWSALATYPWPCPRVYTFADAGDADGTGDRYRAKAQKALGSRGVHVQLEGGDFEQVCRSWETVQAVCLAAAPAWDRLLWGAFTQALLAPLLDSPEVLLSLSDLRREKPQRADAVVALWNGQGSLLEARLRSLEGSREEEVPDLSERPVPVAEALADLLKHHTLPQGLRVPPGWGLSPSGLYLFRQDEEGGTQRTRKAVGPMLISGILRGEEGRGTEWLLEWPVQGPTGWTWNKRTLPRADAQDARKILALADGAPVNSTNAAHWVRYLAEFEAFNAREIPVARVTRRTGWHGAEGEEVFLLGERFVTASGEWRSTEEEPARWPKNYCLFSGDAGVLSAMRAYREEGTFEGWKEAISPVLDRPGMVIPLLASFLPPLMQWVPRIAPFVVDISGITSRGKTTALQVAASVWGEPSEQARWVGDAMVPSAIQTWDQTYVFIERLASVSHGLPLIFDDTKKAKPAEKVADVIYSVCSGQGRGRGTKEGIAVKTAWRTLLLQTGEVPATRLVAGQHGGAAARLLEITDLPMGPESEENARVANRLREGLLQHYGQAGRLFVQEMARGGSALKQELRARYDVLLQWARAGRNSAVEQRAAAYLAALVLVQELLERWFGLTFQCRPLEVVEEAVGRARENADLGGSALEYVLAWATSHQSEFYDGVNRSSPPNGWAGEWNRRVDPWNRLAFLVSRLKPVLEAGGFHYEEVIAQWSARGWLQESRGRRSINVRIGEVTGRCLVLQRVKLPEGLLEE